MNYLGDFAEDSTVYVMFNTFTSDDPSASSTITNFINTDVHIHKDDGLAQRNNAAGITVSVDFDGITGSHMIKIDTNENTVAGFWVTGSDYFVRIEGTTIDGATINAVIAHFSIENRFKEVDVVKWLGQACPAVTVNGVPKVDMSYILGHLLTQTGTQIADAFEKMFDVASPVLLASTVMRGTDNANTTAQTGDSYAVVNHVDHGNAKLVRSTTPANKLDINATGEAGADLVRIMATALTEGAGGRLAVAFIKLFDVVTPTLVASDVMRGTDNAALASVVGALSDVAAVGDPTDADTIMDYIKQLINIFIGTDGIGAWPAEAAPGNAVSIAEVLRALHVDVTGLNGDAMRGTDSGPTKAEMDTAHALLATPAEVASALTDIHLDHIFHAEYNPAAKPGNAAALFNELIEDDGGVSRFTANALEQSPAGTAPQRILNTTIASITSQTEFVLTAGADFDDAYKDQAVVLKDVTNNNYPSVGKITAYTGATKTVTLSSAPDFTIASSDTVEVFETAPGTTAPTVGEIRTEMDDNSTQFDGIKTVTDKLDDTLEDDSGVYRFTENALEQAPSEAGAGATSWTYTLTDSATGDPIADADVWVTTDEAGTNVIASGQTDQNGAVTFMLDIGTIYVWSQKTGWNFTNPDTEVVS